MTRHRISAALVACAIGVPSVASAGTITSLTLSPNPVKPGTIFTILITGQGVCDKVSLYWDKNHLGDYENLQFGARGGTPFSIKTDATVPGRHTIAVKPARGSRNCEGSASAILTVLSAAVRPIESAPQRTSVPGTAGAVKIQPGVQQIGPFIAYALHVQRTKEETKGDIYLPAEWATSMAFADRGRMRFRYTRSPASGGKSGVPAEWRLYDGVPPAGDVAGTAPNLLAKGNAGPLPLSAKAYTEFDINLQNVLPAKPNNRTYHVRLAGKNTSGAYTAAMSPVVALKYEAPVGTKFTTKDLRPELWKPLPVEIKISNFTAITAQENEALSNGDEPYLMVFAVFADGTSIKPTLNFATRALEFTGSSIRLFSSLQTHGNLPLPYGHLDSGQGCVIPAATGTFQTTMLPMGLDVLDEIENLPGIPGILTVNTALPTAETLMANTVAALVVIALEEDASPTDLTDLLRQEAATRLKQKLDQKLAGLVVKNPASVKEAKDAFNAEAIAQIASELQAELTKIGVEFHQLDAFDPFKIHQVTDPDDRIGVRVELFNYAQFLKAGTAGQSFTMNFSGDAATYRIIGSIRRR